MSDGSNKCCSQEKIKANSKEKIMADSFRLAEASEALLGNASGTGWCVCVLKEAHPPFSASFRPHIHCLQNLYDKLDKGANIEPHFFPLLG